MWRALAWEARARLELQRRNFDPALEFIGCAHAVTDGYEIALADWRLFATHAAVCEAMGLTTPATQQAQLSRAAKTRLAESLPQGALRANLLAI